MNLPENFLQTPDCTFNTIHSLLEGAALPGKPFHWLTFATTNQSGAPNQRMVVIRKYDNIANKLYFHTDMRSDKVQELSAQPQTHLLGFDPALQLQLRIKAKSELEHNPAICDEIWQLAVETNQLAYSQHVVPGTGLTAHLMLEEFVVDPHRARGHFAIVSSQIQQIDLLWLLPGGHRRCFVALAQSGEMEMKLVAP
ncbi:MAG: pyridoxamine 5'-phosphate oxidase family protein [Zavarzinella sp.]